MELTSDPLFPVKIRPPRRHLTPAEWRRRAKERSEAEKRQLEGIESQNIFKATVEAKLLRAGARQVCESRGGQWFANFLRCGVETFYIMCPICETGHEAFYQCSQKWCPRCNWRIAMNRRELLKVVTNGMTHVKHVVLTQRNFDHLTREKIVASRKALLDLRRQKIFGKVTGGCASLEFTNEEKGWHMHWHVLVQSSFIPASNLAIAWGKLVGQEYAIVKVKDVSEKSYLQELCKYVVDGSELARWKPERILEFVLALRGTRLFTTFGKFKAIAKFARAVVKANKVESVCESCGETDKIFGVDRNMAKRVAAKKGY